MENKLLNTTFGYDIQWGSFAQCKLDTITHGAGKRTKGLNSPMHDGHWTHSPVIVFMPCARAGLHVNHACTGGFDSNPDTTKIGAESLAWSFSLHTISGYEEIKNQPWRSGSVNEEKNPTSHIDAKNSNLYYLKITRPYFISDRPYIWSMGVINIHRKDQRCDSCDRTIINAIRVIVNEHYFTIRQD